MTQIKLGTTFKKIAQRHKIIPALLSAGLLAGCATTAPELDAATPRAAVMQPVEAPAVANPNFPGISSIIYEFKDGTQRQCWGDREKGAQITPDGVGSEYFKLNDGGVAVRVGSASAGVITARIVGSDVYAVGNDGKVGKLNNEQANPLVETFTALQGNCQGALTDTSKNLLPAGYGRPGTSLTLGTQTPLARVSFVPR